MSGRIYCINRKVHNFTGQAIFIIVTVEHDFTSSDIMMYYVIIIIFIIMKREFDSVVGFFTKAIEENGVMMAVIASFSITGVVR